MVAWMLYVVMVSLLLSLGAFLAERAARLKQTGTRWIWVTAIIASLALPTLVSSVTFEFPRVLDEQVAPKIVALRQATTLTLSPAVWFTGEPEPESWRVADATIRQLWLGVSIAMLLALIVSGIQLALRKRGWRRETLGGTSVYLTQDVGPAVVGLLRPSIALPHWVKQASAPQQTAVLAHEQSHLDARDPQLFTFALALLVFMPWNLPLWWQLRRLRYAIEIDCDARVLKSGVDPAHYGETLIVVGERQSAYVGAVAAMSESKSFLEERIEHMMRKPVRWRRLGAATLASVAIALTAVAAQVSPPNADAPAPVAATATKKERMEIKLPAATLDRYVGVYKVDANQLLKVTRAGDKLMAQITGQPALQIFAESETAFFYKAVDAQVEFVADGGPATSAVIRQSGHVINMARVDSATVSQIEADRAARIASNTPAPGSEAAARKMITAISAGSPNYDDMEPELQKAVREQSPHMTPIIQSLGGIKSIDFQKVGDGGWDVYRVQYEKGSLMWRIGLGANGKVNYALTLPDA
jgi:beta-lactamase regulating signal transducer with metallopeptidase domain